MKDHTLMRRVGEILSKGSSQIGHMMKIRQNWKEIAGEVLSGHTEPVLIKNRVLHVICDSPAWAQQIGMLTKVLEKQVIEMTGIRIIRVEGQFGPARRNPLKVAVPRPFIKPDIDPEDLKKITDPILAKAVLELLNIEEK